MRIGGDLAGLQAQLTGAGAGRTLDSEVRLVVVGAGGWLGMATLELLHALLGEAFFHRVVCFGSDAGEVRLRGSLRIAKHALPTIVDLPRAPTFVLHNAFLTQEKARTLPADAYAAANRSISQTVFGALDAIGCEGVFLPSSGAVYSVDKPGAHEAMRLYGALKRADETWVAEWTRQTGARAVIARVFNLSGPYINKQSSYALACFIADALADRPIEIRAGHPVYRSYVAIAELMSVVFATLTDAEAGACLFDTAGDDVLEMGEVAEIVCDRLGHARGVRRAAPDGGEPDVYVGDGAAFAQLRRRHQVPSISFADQVVETARYMSESLPATAAAQGKVTP